jgi:hypothetical protein
MRPQRSKLTANLELGRKEITSLISARKQMIETVQSARLWPPSTTLVVFSQPVPPASRRPPGRETEVRVISVPACSTAPDEHIIAEAESPRMLPHKYESPDSQSELGSKLHDVLPNRLSKFYPTDLSSIL